MSHEVERERAQADTDRAYERMAAALSPAEMRKRASLVLRCADCGGRVVGWVLWLEGRPLFVGIAGHGSNTAYLLDVPLFAPPVLRCRARSWRFGNAWSSGIEFPEFPGPGERRAERRLQHDDALSVL